MVGVAQLVEHLVVVQEVAGSSPVTHPIGCCGPYAGSVAAIDVNADLGEIPGTAGETIDAELLQIVTSANVAAGGHAGDDESMARVCTIAAARGVAVGAHISYPDRENFGRAPMSLPAAELTAELTAQLERLWSVAADSGTRVTYVKPHGALYNEAARDAHLAEILVAAVRPFGLPVLTLPERQLARMATRAGLVAYAEAFVDRAYTDDGSLQPRRFPDALITDPQQVRQRAVALARGHAVAAVSGSEVVVRAQSLCVHSDSPGAVRLARSVRDALLAHNVAVAPFTSPDTAAAPPHRMVGEDGVLLLSPDPAQREALGGVTGAVPGLLEVVPGAHTVLVRFDPDRTTAATVARHVAEAASSGAVRRPREHFLDVRYDGADLAEVAEVTGLSAAEVIQRHSSRTYTAEFCGFSPGFAYLSGSDPHLHLPRRTTPRTRVEPGSVAIADRYTAVYPTASPGGWHLLGTTAAALFDPARTDPALIRPGDRVRFSPIEP